MRYELTPTDNRSSFYGKCFVIEENGVKTLFSYNTKIMSIESDGSIRRYYDDWTATTGRHIKAFCGLNKKEFMKIPVCL